MTKEQQQAATSKIIDFQEKLAERNKKNQQPFDELAQKLEKRISDIEKQVKDSIHLLETDVQKLAKNNSSYVSSQEFKDEFALFSQTLENRIKHSLEELRSESKDNMSREEIKFVKKLTKQLTDVLSFEFYKNTLQRLDEKTNQEEVDQFGMDPRFLKKVKPLFDFFYYKYWRVETTGISNIPNHGRALLVGNHSGGLPYDGAMMASAVVNEHPVRKDARFLVEDFVYHMPMLGTFMHRIGAIRACPENAERLLNKEHLVVVFPEGVKGIGKLYNQRYKLQRFGRGGFIKLCMKTKAPAIPVGIVGAEEIHPIIFKSNILAKTIGIPYLPITPTFPWLGLLGTIPFPTKWHIHFGEPISFDHYKKSAIEDELLIHKLSEQMREEIQSILVTLLKKRRSVWLG